MSVRKPITLFVALSALALLVGCGSSSPTPVAPPSGAFSASDLKGTYVFSSTGLDASGGSLAIAGTVVANGTGGITGGTIDIVGPDVTQTTPVAQAITSGSYSVSPDGRGQIRLGLVTMAFVLTSSSHGLITEFDGNGSGSGTIDLQGAVTLAQLAGSYAFSFGGFDSSEFPAASVGSFALDSTGDVTGGIQDFNDDSIPVLAQQILPGTATLGTGTGPGSITLTTATFGTLTFDYYPIDATHLKFIETDYSEFLAGDGFSQTGATIPTGPMVFTVAGLDSSGSVAAGGLLTSVDGLGNFTGGLEDVNNGGDVLPQLSFSGTPAAAAGTGGRVVVNLSGFTPAIQYVIYPSNGGVLMLETDSLALTSGAAYAQTSQTFATSAGYGLNISAFNTGEGEGGFEEDDIAEFSTTSSAFSGIDDVNDEGSIFPGQSLSGSYTVDSPVTGRGEATTTTFINYTFYVVNSSTVLFLETDENQIGAGILELQSAPGSAGAAQARIAMVHPVTRAHTASRRK
jgi:hypothetical protein